MKSGYMLDLSRVGSMYPVKNRQQRVKEEKAGI